VVLFDVQMRGSKDASERLLFRNLQFGAPAIPRRFAVKFVTEKDVRVSSRIAE
jgi:hypothetical protein